MLPLYVCLNSLFVAAGWEWFPLLYQIIEQTIGNVEHNRYARACYSEFKSKHPSSYSIRLWHWFTYNQGDLVCVFDSWSFYYFGDSKSSVQSLCSSDSLVATCYDIFLSCIHCKWVPKFISIVGIAIPIFCKGLEIF